MGFKALTVNTAAEAAGHIYAEDDAAIFQSMFGGDGVLNIGNCLKSTVISNNKVRISDGVLCVGGHIGRLSYADYQDMTIENGTSGYNRNDIIYAKFLANGNVDSYTLAVKKGTATTGTATDPALLQGDLYEGATERDYPLYRVKLSGLSIESVDQLFSVIPTIPDLKAQMTKDKEEINQSLTTFETGNINFVGSVDNITGTSGYVVKNGHIAIASFEFSFKTGYPFNGKAKIGTLPFKAKHASYDGFVCNLNNGQIASIYVTGNELILQSNNTIAENVVLRGGIVYFAE